MFRQIKKAIKHVKYDKKLISAIENNLLDEVKVYLKKGANPNAKSFFGQSALILAAEKGNLEMVQILLKEGADVNAKGAIDRKSSVLMLAAANGNPEIVQILLKEGADVNARDADGNNVLMYASFNDFGSRRGRGYEGLRNKETVQILLEAGADVNVKNNFDFSLLQLASYRASSSRSINIVADIQRSQYVDRLRTYLRLLNQGWRNQNWINKDGVKANIFLALPPELLRYIAAITANSTESSLDDRTKQNISTMSNRFFAKPPSNKIDIKAEEEYVIELKYRPKT